MSEDEEFEFRARAEQEAAKGGAVASGPAPSIADNVGAYAAQSAAPAAVGLGSNLVKNVWNMPASSVTGVITSPLQTARAVAQGVENMIPTVADAAAGPVLNQARSMTVGELAKLGARGVGGALLAPENLMTLPYNMAAYEQAKIRANPTAPEYAKNPYAQTVRGEYPTQGAAGAANARNALINQSFGGVTPQEQAILQADRQRQLTMQQSKAVLQQPPAAGNFIERMKALSNLYGGVGQ